MKCLKCGDETSFFGWRDRKETWGDQMADNDSDRFELMWFHDWRPSCVIYLGQRVLIPAEMESRVIKSTDRADDSTS